MAASVLPQIIVRIPIYGDMHVEGCPCRITAFPMSLTYTNFLASVLHRSNVQRAIASAEKYFSARFVGIMVGGPKRINQCNFKKFHEKMTEKWVFDFALKYYSHTMFMAKE